MILLLTKLLLTAVIIFIVALGMHKILEPERYEEPSEKEKKVLEILEKVFAYAFLAIIVLFVILALLIVWFI